MFTNIEPLKALYAELLAAIPKDYPNGICAFAAQTGKKYYEAAPRCLFVGKAANSWITDDQCPRMYLPNSSAKKAALLM
jgi:hypothetical protein